MRIPPKTLQTALVCYWSADPRMHLEAFKKAGGSNYADDLDWLNDHGLTDAEDKITDKGRAWIEHMLSTPLPVQSWIIPEINEASHY